MGLQGAKQQFSQFKSSLTDRQSLALRLLRLNTQARRGEITRRHLNQAETAFLNAVPKAPFMTGRALFMSKELRKRVVDSPVSERMGEISSKWESLPEAERSLYDNQAKLDQQQFVEAMKKFLYEL